MRKFTEEHKRKIGEANRGKKRGKQSEETIRKRFLWRKGYKHSEETKRKIGIANALSLKGKKLSKETKRKISESHKGKNTWSKGKKHSEESKRKMSEALKGKKKPPFSEEHRRKIGEASKGRPSAMKGIVGEKHPGWKGGGKASRVRDKAMRRQLGFIPINECEIDGWVGHHLNYNCVIYIPKEIHISVAHSVLKNRNMEKINQKVYEWANEYYKNKNQEQIINYFKIGGKYGYKTSNPLSLLRNTD